MERLFEGYGTEFGEVRAVAADKFVGMHDHESEDYGGGLDYDEGDVN